MTVAEAVRAVRTVLDESGYDYYDDTDILMALEQAQLEKVREYYYHSTGRGRKFFLQPLWRDVVLSNGVLSSRGDTEHTLVGIDPVLFPLQVFVRLYADEPLPGRRATLMSPERYVSYVFSNPSVNQTRGGKLIASYFGGRLHHNGAPSGSGERACRFVFYAEPALPTLSSQFAVPPLAHGQVVDRAARLLADKNMSDPWHDGVGSMAEILQELQKPTEGVVNAG